MSLRRPVLACTSVLVCAALVLTGCSGSSSERSDSPAAVTPDALVVDGEVDQDALDALMAEIDDLELGEVDQRATEASRELELALYDASGLTDALGGDDAAQDSIDETAAWLGDLAAEAEDRMGRPSARVSPFGSLPAGRQLEAFATGMWGAFQVGALESRAASDLVAGGGGKPTDTSSGKTISRSTGTEGTVATVATHTDEAGVTTEVSTTSTVACPEADGTFRASARADISSLAGDGRTGKRGSMSVTVIGTVGDSAQLLSHDTTYTGEMADFGAGRGSYVEIRGTRSAEGQDTAAVTRSAGVADPSITFLSALLASAAEKYFGDELLAGAQKVWESGVCVVLQPTVSAGPSGLDPGQSVEVVADPRARGDGQPTGGKVTAVLSAGAASIAPGEAPARATFTYTAPPERDETGTVALESRSRRGVGRAEITFDTKQVSYVASGGGEVAFSGKVPSVTAPFSVSGTFPGGSTTFAFDAATPTGGKVTVSGGGGGATLTGSGTYTLRKQAGGVLLLVAKVRSCVDVSKICRSTTHPITLTPER